MPRNIAAILFVMLLTGLFLPGCSTGDAGGLDRLQLGMTKAQAVAIMGAPDHVVTTGNEENLVYYLQATDAMRKHGYVVQLVDGKVHYFGEMLTLMVPAAAGSTGAPMAP